MQSAAFEWDDPRRRRTLRNGVSFATATKVFADPFAIERLDSRRDYGEERFVIVGMVDGRLLYVAFTRRAERTRIISARAAEPLERREYHEENS